MSAALTSWSFTKTQALLSLVALVAISACVMTTSLWPVLSAVCTTKVGASLPPTSPGIMRIRLPSSRSISAMSAALTSWSFTKTQALLSLAAALAISSWFICTTECPDWSATSTLNIGFLSMCNHFCKAYTLSAYKQTTFL